MENKRRLSWFRLILAVFVVAGVSVASLLSLNKFQESRIAVPNKPWFAPYVDVTARPIYAFEQTENAKMHTNVILSFIVSSKTDECSPSWGSFYTLDEANSDFDLDRRIARFRQQGGNVAVSFGGLLNHELAVYCKDHNKLKEAYLSVIDRYGTDTIDLDLEGEDLRDAESIKRRAQVLAELQKILRENGENLAIWLTLPVAPQGLTEEGTNAIALMLSNGVDLSGVNVMTMDYGESRDENMSMQEASQKALSETRRQLGVLYDQAGFNLSDTVLWAKVGATPMIGQNDIFKEIFTIEDAIGFNEFAASKGVGRMSMWSGNRDIECGENYVSVSVVSDSCSGVGQDKFSFTSVLSKGFDGDIYSNASLKTMSDLNIMQEPDDPDESPYQIWSESATYLQGTKVVWHRNVYEAKWWNRSELPDNPVLQAWETPWQLIGPVLPGEKPVAEPALPPGTYPEWSGTEIYQSGQRVLFNSIPFEAKWWTQGDSPAASTSNPDSSPWIMLTQKQVEEIASSLN